MPAKKKMSDKSDKRRRKKIVVGRDASGAPIEKWASGRTKAELEANAAELRKKFISGNTAIERDILFGAFVTNWYELYKRPHLSPASQSTYAAMINAHLMDALGDRQMRAIGTDDLQLLLNSNASSKSKIDKLNMLLKQIFSAAQAKGIIDRDPTVLLRKPVAPEGERRELTPNEAAAALSVGNTHKEGLLLLILYYTGVRIGEALGLQWGDIDFKNSTISICRDIDYKKKRPIDYKIDDTMYKIGDVKNEESVRNIPLVNELRVALEPIRGFGQTFVVQSDGGGFLAERTFRRRWVRLMTAMYQADTTIEHIEVPLEAKKKKENISTASRGPYKKRPRPIMSILTPHYFRHNFASVLYANGVDVLTAQKWLGHKKVETTLGIYAHLSRKREKVDVAKIQAAFAIPKAIGD